MKLFYTGPVINAELLLVMLEKHGIQAEQRPEPEEQDPEDSEEDLSRVVEVFVPESEYDRAYQLFYADREDEL